MRRTSIIVLAAAAAMVAFAPSLHGQDRSAGVPGGTVRYALVLSDRNGHELGDIPLPNDRFDLLYVHSFHLTPVAERFRVEPGRDGPPILRLFELEYESSGVGMPADAENGYRLIDGKFVLSMDRSFPSIPLMVSIVPGHGILAGGVFHPFTDWMPPESMLVLVPRKLPDNPPGR